MNIGGLQISIGGRRRGGGAWSPTTPLGGESVDKWVSGRSGLVMPNVVTPGTNDATILPAYLSTNGVSDSILLTNNFINTASGYVEALVNVVDGEVQEILSSSYNVSNVYFARFIISTTRNPQIYCKNTTTFTNLITATNAITAGWHTIRWGSTGSAYYINVDGTTVALTVTSGTNNGKWFNLVPNRNRIGIGMFGGNTIAYTKLRCAYIAVDSTNLWICNNPYYVYDIIGGLHIPITTAMTPIPIVYGGLFSHLFDYGYSLYVVLGSNYQLQIPHKADGTAIISPPVPETYTFDSDIAGNLVYHNLTDSLIDIPGTAWDRSDATLCTDAARAAGTYYDAANPNRWHISFLNRLYLSTIYFNTDYQGLAFVKVSNSSFYDRLLLKELFSFATNKTGADLTSILTYTGDNQLHTINIVLEGHSLMSHVEGIGLFSTKSLQVGIGTHFLYDVAVSGKVIATMVSEKAANMTANKSATEVNIAAVFIGTNDLLGTVGQGTSVYNTLHSYVDGLITDGWTVIVLTMTKVDRVIFGDKTPAQNAIIESERVIYNGLINGHGGAWNVLDVGGMAEFQDPTDLTYYITDAVHYTTLGYQVIAQALADLVATL